MTGWQGNSSPPLKVAVWPALAPEAEYCRSVTPYSVLDTVKPDTELLDEYDTYSTRPLLGPPSTVSYEDESYISQHACSPGFRKVDASFQKLLFRMPSDEMLAWQFAGSQRLELQTIECNILGLKLQSKFEQNFARGFLTWSNLRPPETTAAAKFKSG